MTQRITPILFTLALAIPLATAEETPRQWEIRVGYGVNPGAKSVKTNYDKAPVRGVVETVETTSSTEGNSGSNIDIIGYLKGTRQGIFGTFIGLGYRNVTWEATNVKTTGHQAVAEAGLLWNLGVQGLDLELPVTLAGGVAKTSMTGVTSAQTNNAFIGSGAVGLRLAYAPVEHVLVTVGGGYTYGGSGSTYVEPKSRNLEGNMAIISSGLTYGAQLGYRF
jgi:hypothetical protein